MQLVRPSHTATMVFWEGGEGATGRSEATQSKAKDRVPNRGRALLARSSTVRCDWTLDLEPGVIVVSGMVMGWRCVQSSWGKSEALYFSSKGKVRERRPAAGSMVACAQTSPRAAMHSL